MGRGHKMPLDKGFGLVECAATLVVWSENEKRRKGGQKGVGFELQGVAGIGVTGG